MPNSFFTSDAQGNIVSRSTYDANTGKVLETIELTEEEKEELNNPESQFSNVESADILQDEKKDTVIQDYPEPSFLQDVQRVGLKTAFGPLQLASDLVVRPFF